MSKEEMQKKDVLKISKEKLSFRLALLSIFISLISIAITSYFSCQQNKLEYEVSQKDYNIGKYKMFSLVSRYAFNCYNQWDHIKNKNLTRENMKTDSVSIKQYMTESEYILKDLRNLEDNPFYIELLKSYDKLDILLLQFQRDIIEIKMGNYTFGAVTYKNFYELFLFLKNNYKDNIFDTDYFKNVEQSFQIFNSGISIN